MTDAMESSGGGDAVGGGGDGLLGRSSLTSRWQLTPWDLAVCVLAGLLVVAFVPSLLFDAWTPRVVLILGFAPVGLAAFVRLCRDREPAALLLGAALVWVLVSSIASPAPRSALLGFAGRDISAVTIVCSAAAWALATTMSARGRAALVNVFVGAAASIALFGVLQVVADVDTGSMALIYGRATGVYANPVYFGAVCAGGVGAAASSWADGRRWWMAVATVALAVGVSLSGSRVALVAVLATIGALAAIRRTRSSIGAAALAVSGLVLGVLIDRSTGAGRNAANRLSESSSGGRLSVWRYGLDAWLDRPIRGYGPGRFRPAVQGRFSLEFVRDHAADEVNQAWFDPHNVGISLLVGVGIVGAVLFVLWAAHWSRGAGGPALFAAVAIAITWLLQPLSLVTLPLAMVLFGAANSPSRAPLHWRLPRSIVGGLVATGLAFGGYVLVADIALESATDDFDGPRAETAARLFGQDSVTSDVVAQIYFGQLAEPGAADAELEWRQRAADAEPDRPYWWSQLAANQIAMSDLDGAEISLQRAVELQPFNTGTLRIEAILALRRFDEGRLATALDTLCALGRPRCEDDAATMIADLQALYDEGVVPAPDDD